jgi:hypothetical protein
MFVLLCFVCFLVEITYPFLTLSIILLSFCYILLFCLQGQSKKKTLSYLKVTKFFFVFPPTTHRQREFCTIYIYNKRELGAVKTQYCVQYMSHGVCFTLCDVFDVTCFKRVRKRLFSHSKYFKHAFTPLIIIMPKVLQKTRY